MLILLKILFSDKLEHDDREPIATFQAIFGCGSSSSEALWGILCPSLSFWVQLSALLVIQSIICNVVAIIIYYGVIKRRGSITAFLTGFALVIPSLIAMPYYLIPALDIRNMCFMISVASTPILTVFRCLEAMYGFSPPAVEAQILHYCLYFGSVIEFVFDPKTNHPVRATRTETLSKARRFVAYYLLLSVLYSLLEPCSYALFDTRVGTTLGNTISDFLQPGHLANNFAVAYLTHVCLHVGTLGFGAAISMLAGIKTMDVADDPFFSSRTPSEFWGRRWNNLVHGVLKRGVFKPVRRYSSRGIAAAATFAASGLLHEYVLSVITFSRDQQNANVTYGMHMAFFVYNAMVFTFEHLVGDLWIFRWTRQSLPPVLVSILVVMTVLPIAHWFTDEYVNSGFYSDYKVGFPIVVCVNDM